MQSKRKRQKLHSGVVTGAVLACTLLGFTSTAYADSHTTVYQADAYGVEVKVGGVAKLGPVAYAKLPSCTPLVATYTASATSANEAGLVGAGAISSVASSTLDSSVGSSDVAGVNLLGGVITASEIKAVSSSSVSNGVFSFSSEGSVFSGLKVLGLPISANVAPNTVISLPLIGSVTLNEQESYVSSTKASLTVNMIHVRITLGANAGTEIIISQGYSDIVTRAAPAAMGGSAYAPRLTTSLGVTTGSLVYELVPCFGTDGVVETDSVGETSLPGVVNTGAVSVTAEGNVTSKETSVQTTSSVAGVNLLSGLLTATAITGVASGTSTTPAVFNFTGGSTLVGLAVSGFAGITDNPPANTKVAIANLGTLYLNRVQKAADHIRVVPIELIVNAENSYGLPVGADLTIGVVEAQLHNSTIP